MVLFSSDFKYKVDPFNVCIIDNYVKKDCWEVYTPSLVTSCAETINKVH